MSPRREPPVIVINRNGRTTTLSGWRAWLAAGTGYLIIGLVALIGIAVMVGLAMTMAMALLFAVPLVLVLVLIAYGTGAFRAGPPR